MFSHLYSFYIVLWYFVRLPFGPKRAPSYFQEQMASVVLARLLYFQCELYLNDVPVFGSSENDFFDNLGKVLVRRDKFEIILKSLKFFFGICRKSSV